MAVQDSVHIEYDLPIWKEADVLVIGGGPAGIAAAVCAARHGAHVILCEQNGYLGGLPTGGLVGPFMTWCNASLADGSGKQLQCLACTRACAHYSL